MCVCTPSEMPKNAATFTLVIRSLIAAQKGKEEGRPMAKKPFSYSPLEALGPPLLQVLAF